MKQIVLEKTDLESCISQAQQERVVIVRNGKPIALIVGIEGMDQEQLALGSDETFWELITRRRKQKGVSRGKLEKKLNGGQ
jgi:antitoxin (DNA-binding transcriptional repressor) of toxin-antitoxin stability system